MLCVISLWLLHIPLLIRRFNVRVMSTAKYGTPNRRIEQLFEFIPEVRRLGLMHYKMTLSTSLGIITGVISGSSSSSSIACIGSDNASSSSSSAYTLSGGATYTSADHCKGEGGTGWCRRRVQRDRSSNISKECHLECWCVRVLLWLRFPQAVYSSVESIRRWLCVDWFELDALPSAGSFGSRKRLH